MHNVLLMAVVDAREDLLHEDGAVALVEFAALQDLVEELATLANLSDQVVALLVLEELVHLDDVGVVLRKTKIWLVGKFAIYESWQKSDRWRPLQKGKVTASVSDAVRSGAVYN